MQWFFFFFLVSGFCSLVYQVVWLRISMSHFGVTTPLVAIVLSVFMAGLALGSWGGGLLASKGRMQGGVVSLRIYAAAEAVIGLSGFVVAPLLALGHNILMKSSGASWGSGSYYLVSAVLVTVALLPFCTCMGATFPLAMASVRAIYPDRAETSFSFLYIANVLGAMSGGLCAAFILIEMLGFRATLLVAAALNLLVALLAIIRSSKSESRARAAVPANAVPAEALPIFRKRRYLLLLFLTGLASLAMEVVWTRQFVPFMGPVVYTFAAILVIYLAATLVGSQIYRRWFRAHPLLGDENGWRMLSCLAAAAAFMPLVAADYRLPLSDELFPSLLRVVVGIGPFCGILGFMTPALLDRVSAGNPQRAGFSYGVNTVGCIVGPLLAGFLLLPLCGEKISLLVLSLPLFLFGIVPFSRRATAPVAGIPAGRFRTLPALLIFLSVVMVFFTRDYEKIFPQGVILRDHTATVVASGEGMYKLLLVNGVGMTKLTPITKMMVHLSLASLENAPRQGLVLCLGMGTSFRSMLSWGIPTTVVELVPSIPSLLPFFQVDGDRLLSAPAGRIVVDDARRFLERTSESFSVVVIDPPPPVEAAASSLLYSREFYSAVAKRLAPDGILQQWIPWQADGFEDKRLLVAMTRALSENFPYVRAFRSLEGWGLHFLASKRPIPLRTAAEIAAVIPDKAAADLVEWGPFETPQAQFAKVLSQEVPLAEIVALSPGAPTLTDDRPLNEYYLLRKHFSN